MAPVPGNPYATSSKTGSFRPYSDGTFQGMADADAASQNWLNMGSFNPSASVVAFGGLPVKEDIFNSNMSNGKSTIDLATTVDEVIGFSVFDQGHHGIITPGPNNVPLFYPGMDLPFYRFGTKARVPVQCSPALAALVGQSIKTPVGWDFATGMLVPTAAGTAVTVTSVAWANGVVTVNTAAAHGLALGMTATLAGFTPAGYNGSIEVLSVPSATSFTYALAADPGAATVQGTVATPAADAFTGLNILTYIPNSRIVFSDPVTGKVTWQDGTCALIQL